MSRRQEVYGTPFPTLVETSTSDLETRSFWLGRTPYRASETLDGSRHVELVIIEGGFTGLWSAIRLKQAEPGLDIAVLEAQVVG